MKYMLCLHVRGPLKLDKAPRLVFILILRRVPQPLQTFCRFFEAPQFSGKCLKVAVFGGLALPHIKTHCCMGFYDHKYDTEEMGGTFLSLGLRWRLWIRGKYSHWCAQIWSPNGSFALTITIFTTARWSCDSESKERISLSVPTIFTEMLSCNVLKLILYSTLHLDHSRNIPKLYIWISCRFPLMPPRA